ncbi:MAG: hypothetical protein WAV51_01580 [Microgenomates group bacterium]
MNHVRPRGQVLLITVLVLSIAITIALSLIGRGITDVSMSRNVEESARAFSAAEAGIEEALKGNLITDARTYVPGVTYQSSSTIIGGSTGEYTLPATNMGAVASIWLVDHNEDNSINESSYYAERYLDVCWTPPTASLPIAAIEVTIYYKSAAGVYMVSRSAYDPDIASRPVNNFSSITEVDGSCGAVAHAYRQSIVMPPVGTIPLLIRVRPFYNQTTVTVSPVGTDVVLPKQGVEITSTGKTDGGVTRKIVVKRQYPWPAAIFDYSVYSQDSFTH